MSHAGPGTLSLAFQKSQNVAILMKFKTCNTERMELYGICCACVLPSGTERFHHNVSDSSCYKELIPRAGGHRGECVHVCMCVHEGHYSCGPCRYTELR